MNPSTLTGRRQVVPAESKPGYLRGWKLTFRMLGLPYLEPGFATIERVDGHSGGSQQHSAGYFPSAASIDGRGRWDSEVHGVLHRVSVQDWIQIMATEGVGAGKSGYRVVEVEVTRYDGRSVRALTLEGQPPSLHTPSRPVSPSRRYLGLLRDGARHHGLHPDYITYLDSLSPYDGSGWNAAAGRAVALAVAMPLALPLLPPVLLLGMTRGQSRKAPRQADGFQSSGATVAESSSAAEFAEAASKGRTAAVRDFVDGGTAAAAAAMTGSAPNRESALAPEDSASSGETLPAQLLRPPLLLPAVASSYVRGIQYVTWAVHDVLAAGLLGSGSSSGADNTDNRKPQI